VLSRASVSGATLVDYVGMLRQGWQIVLVCGVVGLLAAVALDKGQPQARFEASATLQVDPHVFVGGGAGVVAVGDPGVPAEEVEAARSARAAARTSEEVGIADSAALLSRIFVSGDDDTHVLTIALQGQYANVKTVLDAYVTNYIDMRTKEFLGELRRRLRLIGKRIAAVKARIGQLESELDREPSDATRTADRTELETLAGVYADLVALRQNTWLNSSTVQEVRLLGGPVLHRAAAFPPEGLQLIAFSFSGLLVGVAIVLGRGSIIRYRGG
jgi:uncharacterized protein involved in exopolysaccharide biosynthesis